MQDVAIIGAGVTGIAIARQLSMAGLDVIVVERGTDLLAGASKANSAILHTGFDAPPDSLELALVQEGYRAFTEIAPAARLPRFQTGAVLAAWTDAEVEALDGILAIAHRNGVSDCRMLTADEALRLEPGLSPSVKAAVHVPGEAIIDPWTPFLTYARQVIALGGKFLFSATLTGAQFDGSAWHLETTAGAVTARTLVNCAGSQGDRVNSILIGEPVFTVKPRKGQFVVFDKASDQLVRGIILPVPNDRTKGVVVTRTIFGNVLVGPTAEEQDERDRPATTTEALSALIAEAGRLVPGLEAMPVTATYAGIRPATDKKEYRISHHAETNLLVVGGIRSTGLTASLGIARHAARLLLGETTVTVDPPWPKVNSLADPMPRDWTKAGYGEIVCHCEMVTRREIDEALAGDCPARDLQGLKRRTRATMGRCQGFHCMARINALLSAATSGEGAR